MTTSRTSPLPRAAPPADVPDGVRIVGSAIITVILWNHLWFYDLSDQALLQADDSGSLFNQLLFPSLALFVVVCASRIGITRDHLRPLVAPPLLACAGWLLLTTVTSVDPLLSAKRLALFALATTSAVGVLLLARSPRQLAQSLALASAVILTCSYLGVVFLPGLATHTEFDVKPEYDHIGLWRGVFFHKNEAGAGMVLIGFVGVYVRSVLDARIGWAIIVAAGVFLLGTFSKTALASLPFILLVTALASATRSPTLRSLLLIGPVAFSSVTALATAFFPAVRDAMRLVLWDVTFTGRTDIWDFAVASIAQRPWVGWGLGAFWRSQETMYGGVATEAWATNAGDAHNGYLDAALIGGLPGLLLTLWVFMATPIRDAFRIADGGPLDPATLLFIRFWCFGVFAASLESVFYNSHNGTCLMMVLGVAGLRLRGCYVYADGRSRPAVRLIGPDETGRLLADLDTYSRG